jgi:hypothetical protein
MHLQSYFILDRTDDYSVHRFLSLGPNGSIAKLIIFSEYNLAENIYNLALVDVINENELSDTHFSNNNDIYKILATVAQTIIDYTNIHPERKIFFEGSDDENKRNSTYQSAISRYYHILNKDFDIEGFLSDGVKEMFQPNNLYKGFLVKRK